MPESPADKALFEQSATRMPLNGLTVLDLTLARAGPTAVRHFADWGANVIRIEPPASDGEDVAGFEDALLVRHAVDDFFVNRDTNDVRKSLIVEKTGLAPQSLELFGSHVGQLLGRHARTQGSSQVRKHCGQHATAFAHSFDFFSCLDSCLHRAHFISQLC